MFVLSLDPSFVHVHLIPDSNEKNDDKLYFFFREKSSEMGQSPKSQSRIGRICLVSSCKISFSQNCAACSVTEKDSAKLGFWILDCSVSICLLLTCWNPHIFDLPAYNTSLYPRDPWTCDLLTRQVSRSKYDRSLSMRKAGWGNDGKCQLCCVLSQVWSLTTSS